MDENELINHLCEEYRLNKNARVIGVVYSPKEKAFSIEINGEQYLLTSNQLSDEIGDVLADQIKLWAHK